MANYINSLTDEKSMHDVITVGSATVDAFVKTEFSELLHGKNKKDCIAYPVGAKILIEELNLTTGGGGTNAAVALARLGHKVAFIGKMGEKENSIRVLSQLKEEKVDTSLVIRSKKGRTGYSVILDSKKHDRTILAFKGSNNDLTVDEIDLKKLRAKWLYFSSMMGQSYRTLEKIAGYAKKNNIKIAFNISSYLARKGKKFLGKILKKTEILILNREESELIVGNSSIVSLLKKLSGLGPDIVAITDGKNGVYVLHKNDFYHGRPHNIRIVETTGAGDAFASSFLSGIIKRNDIRFAIQLGMTNAESVIQNHGAKTGLLHYNKALEIIKKYPIKISKIPNSR